MKNKSANKSHFRTFLSGISTLLKNKEAQTRDYNFRGWTKAFTLIELLVVVLIIGILAAIALPQYQKAVAKARFAELKIITKQLYNAQQVYFLENGHYSNKRDELPISLGPVQANASDYAVPFAHGSCGLEGAVNNEKPGTQNIYCKLNKPEILLRLYLTTTMKMCCNYELNNTSLDQICKEEMKTNSVYGEDTTRRCYVSY